ncbi:MAG: hypothetical protein QOD30_1067 [Actinomycetota bacterium]|jgi:hypothetical protein|nr:hypothetical protein [Actinomycetota bacterium]
MATPLRHVRQVLPDERAPKPPSEPDWAAQTADTIDRVVTSIRSKTADPLDHIVRIVVYGILAGVLGIGALVLLAIALVRAVDVAIPGRVWSAHLAVGGIFTLAGLFLWSKRRTPGDR